MRDLISPDFNLSVFCHVMFGKDPNQVTEAASAEAAIAHYLLRTRTKATSFRKGSAGRVYCDQLQMLCYMVTNGKVPPDSDHDFLLIVKPLIEDLLRRWEIGNLRQVFARFSQPSVGIPPAIADPLVVVVARSDVASSNTSPALTVLKRLIESPATAGSFVERVDFAFHGFDGVREELWEIPEVRNFVYALDGQFPFWLFFLSKRHLGLHALLYCFLPPFLTEAAQATVYPQEIDRLLQRRWFPAMNQMCEYAGFSEKQIEQLSERAFSYITSGPLSDEYRLA